LNRRSSVYDPVSDLHIELWIQKKILRHASYCEQTAYRECRS
jgi:hypothetical protein